MYFIKKVNRALAMPRFLWVSELDLRAGNARHVRWCKQRATQAYPCKIRLSDMTEIIYISI